MRYLVLACDYDGTLASDGVVSEETLAALQRLRDSGRKLILVTGRELENLVRDLCHCAMPYTCPHGRPTLIEMNFRELEKKFGRTQ